MPASGFGQGTWEAGMPYLRMGDGPPLLFMPGFSGHHRQPRGLDLRMQLQQIKPYAQDRTVWWVNRRPGLSSGVTMADLARDYAEAMRARFREPVDVIGISTGGSVALQLAADHPGVVRRLAIVASAYRLGDAGRDTQRKAADRLGAGRPRQAATVILSSLGGGPVSRALLGMAGRLAGTAVYGDADPDMLMTIRAEDDFDLQDRLGEISAPTLVVGGANDAFYSAELFHETAELIPDSRLVLLPGKGHLTTLTSRHLPHGVLTFLDSSR